MQVVEFVTANLKAVAIGTCVIVGLLAVAWPRKRVRRKRLYCDLTPLEIRAYDVVTALDELSLAIDQAGGQLDPQVHPSWVVARTASQYLKRFLDEGR